MHSGLGTYLNDLRKNVSKLTTVAVAEQVGISQSYVSKIERGQIGAVDPKVLAKLLTALRGAEDGERTFRLVVAALELKAFLDEGPTPFGTDRFREAMRLSNVLYQHTPRFISFSPYLRPPMWPNGTDDELPMEWKLETMEYPQMLDTAREWMFGVCGAAGLDHYMGSREPYSSWITTKAVMNDLIKNELYIKTYCRRHWRNGRLKLWEPSTIEDRYLTAHYINLDSTVTLVHNGVFVDVTFDPALTARLNRIDREATALGMEMMPHYESKEPIQGDPESQKLTGVMARIWHRVFG